MLFFALQTAFIGLGLVSAVLSLPPRSSEGRGQVGQYCLFFFTLGFLSLPFWRLANYSIITETERNQLGTYSRLENEYFVELLGYCLESGQRVLIYEFATQGSLHDTLHGKKGSQGAEPGILLNWNQRVKIAYGAARGLEYLHKKHSLL